MNLKETLEEIAQHDFVNYIKLENNTYFNNLRIYTNPTRTKHSLRISVNANNDFEVRGLSNMIRRALNISTMTKTFWGDAEILYKANLGKINITIWINLPKKEGLSILSTMFNCNMKKETKRTWIISSSVVCPKNH